MKGASRLNLPLAFLLLLSFFSFDAAYAVTFNYKGHPETWVVPNNVNSIKIDARGAQGGGNPGAPTPMGGKGGRVQTSLAVMPGQTLIIYVGGRGGDLIGPNRAGRGGFNGGGAGGTDNVDFNAPAGGGGGASDVRQGGADLSHRIVVAGAGGGAECCSGVFGGKGGGLIAAPGGTAGGGSSPGGGGTQSGGGAGGFGCNGNGGRGALLRGGVGGNGNRAGGGGGGGYFGGGGGGGCLFGSGGGGGSSYSAGTRTNHTRGFQTGNGLVIITPITSGFLNFPLKHQTPYTRPINAVFDHSEIKPYTNNKKVVAYTGEQGKCATGNQDFKGPVGSHAGFRQLNGEPFTVNKKYAGGGQYCKTLDCKGTSLSPLRCSTFLFYDGHPGIDFRTKDLGGCGRVDVIAAVSGTLYYPDEIVGANGKRFHVLAIRPDAHPDYRIYYLHLSTYPGITTPDAKNCEAPPIITAGEDVKNGTHVKAGQVIGKVGHAGLPPGQDHLHFEVQKVLPLTQANNQARNLLRCKEDATKVCIPVDPYGWKPLANCDGNNILCDDPYPYLNKFLANENLWK
jgi:hypothetical protein